MTKKGEALLREFASVDPIDQSGDCLYCLNAARHWNHLAMRWESVAPALARHEPGCLWRRAAEALGVPPAERILADHSGPPTPL